MQTCIDELLSQGFAPARAVHDFGTGVTGHIQQALLLLMYCNVSTTMQCPEVRRGSRSICWCWTATGRKWSRFHWTWGHATLPSPPPALPCRPTCGLGTGDSYAQAILSSELKHLQLVPVMPAAACHTWYHMPVALHALRSLFALGLMQQRGCLGVLASTTHCTDDADCTCPCHHSDSGGASVVAHSVLQHAAKAAVNTVRHSIGQKGYKR